MTEKTSYSHAQIALHWLVALLVFGAWLTGDAMSELYRDAMRSGTATGGPTPHTIMGIAVFGLVLVRLVLRAMQGAPGPAAGTAPLMAQAAKWGHRLLYLLVIAVPAAGAATWIGGIRAAGDLHESLAQALVLLACGHAAVAIFHQFVLRDGTLGRMVRTRG